MVWMPIKNPQKLSFYEYTTKNFLPNYSSVTIIIKKTEIFVSLLQNQHVACYTFSFYNFKMSPWNRFCENIMAFVSEKFSF